MRIDGFYLGPIQWDLWKTFCRYEAEEQGGRVEVLEQRRKFIPKKRRIIRFKEGHEKHEG